MPLGPSSLSWRYGGDLRTYFVALWAGSMQNMHPQLGAAVEQHSKFFAERWQRLNRSLYPIDGMVYDGDRATETAREVRGYHADISGVDRNGNRYHALDPDTFFWAHSTFYMGLVLAADVFMGGLDEGQRARMYDEYIELYRQYGMSMRPVPATYAEFLAYWEHMCAEVLEDNKATRDVLDLDELAKPPVLPWLPDPVWRLARFPVARGYRWITVGLYPPAVRERLGFTWNSRDERLLRILGRVVHIAWHLVPPALRYRPRARAGWRRAQGLDAADAPLVHTPARNLPPLDERDDPRHYQGARVIPPATTPAARTPRTATGR
ncbi:oxygenase MpaB family protein [Pseudonocardia sp. CA-107938]|uniref:oxygenase MpaB family protein n=1 Tax=Pseudonocardia sp. CA-107938 TaxID=3240021 RepID=UPI003D926A2C